MPLRGQEDIYGAESPGGFVFGVSGWHWGDPRPTTITFYLDNTVKLCDQHGRPIREIITDGRSIKLAQGTASTTDKANARRDLGTHAQVIEALRSESIDWQRLTCAGWPQLPYAELKKLPVLPPTPVEELRKIADHTLRKDALRARREADEAMAKEMQAAAEE